MAQAFAGEHYTKPVGLRGSLLQMPTTQANPDLACWSIIHGAHADATLINLQRGEDDVLTRPLKK